MVEARHCVVQMHAQLPACQVGVCQHHQPLALCLKVAQVLGHIVQLALGAPTHIHLMTAQQNSSQSPASASLAMVVELDSVALRLVWLPLNYLAGL